MQRSWNPGQEAKGWYGLNIACREDPTESEVADLKGTVSGDHVKERPWDLEWDTRPKNERRAPCDTYRTATEHAWTGKGQKPSQPEGP
jgi:hypothetical protein